MCVDSQQPRAGHIRARTTVMIATTRMFSCAAIPDWHSAALPRRPPCEECEDAPGTEEHVLHGGEAGFRAPVRAHRDSHGEPPISILSLLSTLFADETRDICFRGGARTDSLPTPLARPSAPPQAPNASMYPAVRPGPAPAGLRPTHCTAENPHTSCRASTDLAFGATAGGDTGTLRQSQCFPMSTRTCCILPRPNRRGISIPSAMQTRPLSTSNIHQLPPEAFARIPPMSTYVAEFAPVWLSGHWRRIQALLSYPPSSLSTHLSSDMPGPGFRSRAPLTSVSR